MNWNSTKLRRPTAKPRHSRNRGVERLNREIRELRAFLHAGAQTISETLRSDAPEDMPMESPDTSSDDATALITDPARLLQHLAVKTAGLRGEFATLDYGFKQCGQAYAELLEMVAERLDALVTPARYRR